jgi:hypothetical protein
MELYTTDYSDSPQNDEHVYRALRDSILQVHHFVQETARKTDPQLVTDLSWEVGDQSLINWISFSRCYLVRPGHKIQFLSKPRFLENISIALQKGDRILICSDALLETQTDADLDEVTKMGKNSDEICHYLMATAKNATPPTAINVVVMEVKDSTKAGTTSPTLAPKKSPPPGKFLLAAALLLGALLLGLLGWSGQWRRWLGPKIDSSLQDTLAFVSKDTNFQPKVEPVPLDMKGGNAPPTTIFSETKPSPAPPAPIAVEPVTKPKPEVKIPPKPVKKPAEPTWTTARKTPLAPRQTERKSTAPVRKSADPPSEVGGSQQQRSALIAQRDRWREIKAGLEQEAAAGRPVSDQLRNAETVLSRIEQKLSTL